MMTDRKSGASKVAGASSSGVENDTEKPEQDAPATPDLAQDAPAILLAETFQFDDANRAIRILRHDTPQPWINYLSNGSIHAFVSQAGGGFAWYKSPIYRRLTRYRQYNLPLDSPGFYVYIRHPDGSVWSPTFRPCETSLDKWEAVHQPGKTNFVAEKNGIRACLTFFVAPDHDVLVWNLKLTNLQDAATDLQVFAYVENSQLGWQNEALYGYYVKLQLKTWFSEETQAVNYLFHHDGMVGAETSPLVYFAARQGIASYSGSRTSFIGNYRSERNPLGVERGDCGKEVIACGDPAAAVQCDVSLTGGDEQRLNFFLGVSPGALVDLPAAKAQQAETLAALRAPGAIDEQLHKLDAWWEEQFSAYQCDIPDAAAQRQINTWNVINSVQAGRYSRAVNQVAPGVRGIGFRDTCQDMLAIAYRRPQWASKTLQQLLGYQYRDGHVVHMFDPQTGEAPSTSVHSDDHLWLPLVAYAILAETGDFSLLDESVPYLDEAGSGTDGDGTVWEHLMAGIRFTEAHLGKHGLPLTLASDWNDIIGRFNRRGEGETVFAGQQVVLALRQLIEIAEAANRSEGPWLADCLARQEKPLLDCAWDGRWWRRGFDDDGNPVGSDACEAGKIFVNPQSWAVLSGTGTKEQQQAAMESVAEKLDCGIGLTLLAPSFSSGVDDKDAAQVGYGPGCGENGAIFCHANTWAVIAEALLGNAVRAWKYFTQLIPANAMAQVGLERYRAEPYAWVSNIVGPENPHFGWANVEQITGTAPWMDVASTQYLLGIRATLEGLLVDPCIPADWPEYTVRRRYRGCELTIIVRNPGGGSKGVASLQLDGQELPVTNGAMVPADKLEGRQQARIEALLDRLERG